MPIWVPPSDPSEAGGPALPKCALIVEAFVTRKKKEEEKTAAVPQPICVRYVLRVRTPAVGDCCAARPLPPGLLRLSQTLDVCGRETETGADAISIIFLPETHSRWILRQSSPPPTHPTGAQRKLPRSGPQSITVISRAAGSAFDEISQQRPGRLRVNVMTPCSRGRPSYTARQRPLPLLCLPFRRVGSCEAMCEAASRLWHGRPAGRLAPLTPQMSGSVRKSFCASRHQTPVMPHLRSQSPTLQKSFVQRWWVEIGV